MEIWDEIKNEILGKTYDGKGGWLNNKWQGLKDTFTGTMYYKAPTTTPTPVTAPISVPPPTSTPLSVPTVPLTSAPTQINYPKLRESIRFNESRGIKNPYSFFQPSGSKKYGNAYGAYQVTRAELNERSKQFLGKKVTPKEFLASPILQDQYMENKLKYQQSQGLNTPEDLLAAHRGGWSNLSPEAKAKRLKERKNYIKTAMEYYNSQSPTEIAKR